MGLTLKSYLIVIVRYYSDRTFEMSKFTWLPDAIFAAAKRLTRFTWTKTLSSTNCWSVFENQRAVCEKYDLQYIHVIWVLLVMYDRTSILTNIDDSSDARCADWYGQMAKFNVDYYFHVLVEHVWHYRNHVIKYLSSIYQLSINLSINSYHQLPLPVLTYLLMVVLDMIKNILQWSFCEFSQPMRNDVAIYRRLPMAGCMQNMISGVATNKVNPEFNESLYY